MSFNRGSRFGILQALRKRVDILRMVVPHVDLVPLQLGEARECADGILVVVEYGDFHKA
jgi:hypothetical protein